MTYQYTPHPNEPPLSNWSGGWSPRIPVQGQGPGQVQQSYPATGGRGGAPGGKLIAIAWCWMMLGINAEDKLSVRTPGENITD